MLRELIDMLWMCATDVLTGKVEPGTEVAIGLHGRVFYSGLAIGVLGEDPADVESSSIAQSDELFK